MDVSVIMQRKFQQFMPIDIEVPQILSIARASDIPVMLLRRALTAQTVQKMRGFHSAVLGDAVDTPVVFQTTGAGLGPANAEKQWRFRSCSTSKVVDVPWFAVHRQGVDVPAIMQRRSLAV